MKNEKGKGWEKKTDGTLKNKATTATSAAAAATDFEIFWSKNLRKGKGIPLESQFPWCTDTHTRKNLKKSLPLEKKLDKRRPTK